MKSHKLTQVLEELKLSKSDLASLIGVSPRAINMWLAGERGVPSTVEAYLSLLAAVPDNLRAKTVAQLRQEDMTIFEGMYTMEYSGDGGGGWGTLVFQSNLIYGHDAGGVRYDGRYTPASTTPGLLDIDLRVTVPPGVPLVTGLPKQVIGFWFDVRTTVAPRSESTLEVLTPSGPIRAVIKFVREIPNRLVD